MTRYNIAPLAFDITFTHSPFRQVMETWTAFPYCEQVESVARHIVHLTFAVLEAREVASAKWLLHPQFETLGR